MITVEDWVTDEMIRDAGFRISRRKKLKRVM